MTSKDRLNKIWTVLMRLCILLCALARSFSANEQKVWKICFKKEACISVYSESNAKYFLPKICYMNT